MNGTAVGSVSFGRFMSMAIDAVRNIRGRQIRAAILLGLIFSAWNWIVFMQPNLYIAQSTPLSSAQAIARSAGTSSGRKV